MRLEKFGHLALPVRRGEMAGHRLDQAHDQKAAAAVTTIELSPVRLDEVPGQVAAARIGRHSADQAVYAAEKLLKDTGDRLPPADRAAIESAIEAVKKAIERNDVAEMTRTMEQLTAAQHRAAEALYRQTQAGGAGASTPPPGGGRPSGAGPGEVIDAEVVEEDKK